MRRATLVRLTALIATVVMAWAVLTLGREGAQVTLQPGDVASREYVANRAADVLDEVATNQEKDAAAASVPDQYTRLTDTENQTYTAVEALFATVKGSILAGTASAIPAIRPAEAQPPTESTTATTVPLAPAATVELDGSVFVDVNRDGIRQTDAADSGGLHPDFGLGDVGVTVVDADGNAVLGADGAPISTTTRPDGTFTLQVPTEEITLSLDSGAGSVAEGLVPAGVPGITVEADCRRQDPCQPTEPFVLEPDFLPVEQVAAGLVQNPEFGLDNETAIATLVSLAQVDFVDAVAGATRTPLLDQVQTAVEDALQSEFAKGIHVDEVAAERALLQTNPPRMPVGYPAELVDDSRTAAAAVIDGYLTYNLSFDEAKTQQLKTDARDGVTDVLVPFAKDEIIAAKGERVTALMIQAIKDTNAAAAGAVPQQAMFGVLTVLVAVLGYYLARFRQNFWAEPKMVALFGILIVMAAGAVRLTLEMEVRTSRFVLPAVVFGYLAAVLFDNRMGTLMALAMGVITAIGFQEPGIAIFGLLATLAPIGFVSSASTRHSFRNSVVVSAVSAGVIAAAVAWYFYAPVDGSPWQTVWQSGAWALAVSMVAALLAQPLLAFFESAFDITTTLRLLDVTDRNHAALQLLQEKAFGTFNHSLMVGTLADAAARAIGANNLLARAAAYYHDLGKTENPTYYIENQFGVPNPHDALTPEESADIIRRHVTDGLELARRYRIPSEVAEGIVSHHGDGIMRYFYEKSRQLRGDDVDPDAFRHAGHKPYSREMAILMMADSVEGACRAAFGEEEPSHDAIIKVVNRVIDEKVGDGQLSECDLTLGELTKVRRAFIEALTGHYHQRIPYPNFPGS